MMTRLLLFAILAAFLGCAPPEASGQPGPKSKVQNESARGTSIVVFGSSLSFDPKTCRRGQAGFGWGLGSVQVNVLGRDDGF